MWVDLDALYLIVAMGSPRLGGAPPQATLHPVGVTFPCIPGDSAPPTDLKTVAFTCQW